MTKWIIGHSKLTANPHQPATSGRKSALRRVVTLGIVLRCLAVVGLACAETQTFTAAGEHIFIVPAGVTTIHAAVTGARGGDGSSAPGGLGGVASADLAVVPGQTLFVSVGGAGGPSGASAGAGTGGFGGGGTGGNSVASNVGAGGGGASDIRTCSVFESPCLDGSMDSLASRLLVAGGGGGGGVDAGTAGGAGGNAGLSDGGGAPGTGASGLLGGQPGGGATQSTIGTAGGSAGSGERGVGGAGSAGGLSPALAQGGAGGGGGGGWFGGGGGSGGESIEGTGGGGGGGAGSSHAGPGTTDVTFSADATGTASATVTYTLPDGSEDHVAFGPTGSEQTFIVPAGVTIVDVMAIGGRGGTGNFNGDGTGGLGGLGAVVGATLNVTPGETLYVEVGGNGIGTFDNSFHPHPYGGGFNGGGGGIMGAGSGGGASDVRRCPRLAGSCPDGSPDTLTSRLVIAGGGGGGGDGVGIGGTGGDGGVGDGGRGGDGGDGAPGTNGGGGGGGGTATQGGAAGIGFDPTLNGSPGMLAVGGDGYIASSGGGGGGGGLYGGGGGGKGHSSDRGGGGGAGSSYVAPMLSNPTFGSDTRGVGEVEISYQLPGSVPDTILREHPKKRIKAKAQKTKVTFTFTSPIAGATFLCKLDQTFAPCSSPKSYRVTPGRHRFQVKATNAFGTDPTPATFRFKVEPPLA